jgi:hypothetical protein
VPDCRTRGRTDICGIADAEGVVTTNGSPNCLWCGGSFAPRRGGSEQRFCSPSHRGEFHAAARRHAERAVAGGFLTIADLRNGHPEAFTLRVDNNTPRPEQGARDAAIVRLDALLDAIFEKLSDDELNLMPESVWALFIFVNELTVGGGGIR